MFEVLSICTLILLIATVLPILTISHWSVRGLDFPRLQLCFALLVLIIAQLTLLDLTMIGSQLMLLTSGICFVWQLKWILPYTPFWPKQVRGTQLTESTSVSVLTSNVLTTNRNFDALLELVKNYQPDILVTLETDQAWEDALDTLDYPHSVKCPLDNLYGMHLYSNLPLENTELSFLIEDDVPSIHTCIRLSNGQSVQAHFLHPAPPSPTENEESKERDAELIIVAKRIASSEMPVIVTDDLNDVAWSATTLLFRKISGLLDPRIGRGMFNTFHAGWLFLRWPLDHLFHSDHFTLKRLKRLPSIDSDHFPLFAELSLEPSQASNKPIPDRSDHQRANEIIDEENISVRDVPAPGSES